MSRNLHKYGVGFWLGGATYSIINLIINLKNASREDILFYNSLIIGVAGIGFILNFTLLKRNGEKKL